MRYENVFLQFQRQMSWYKISPYIQRERCSDKHYHNRLNNSQLPIVAIKALSINITKIVRFWHLKLT